MFPLDSWKDAYGWMWSSHNIFFLLVIHRKRGILQQHTKTEEYEHTNAMVGSHEKKRRKTNKWPERKWEMSELELYNN